MKFSLYIRWCVMAKWFRHRGWFERQFRMRRAVFNCIFEKVVADTDYFRKGRRPNAVGTHGMSPLLTVVVALRYDCLRLICTAHSRFCRLRRWGLALIAYWGLLVYWDWASSAKSAHKSLAITSQVACHYFKERTHSVHMVHTPHWWPAISDKDKERTQNSCHNSFISYDS